MYHRFDITIFLLVCSFEIFFYFYLKNMQSLPMSGYNKYFCFSIYQNNHNIIVIKYHYKYKNSTKESVLLNF